MRAQASFVAMAFSQPVKSGHTVNFDCTGIKHKAENSGDDPFVWCPFDLDAPDFLPGAKRGDLDRMLRLMVPPPPANPARPTPRPPGTSPPTAPAQSPAAQPPGPPRPQSKVHYHLTTNPPQGLHLPPAPHFRLASISFRYTTLPPPFSSLPPSSLPGACTLGCHLGWRRL